jgi:hypothetical protein
MRWRLHKPTIYGLLCGWSALFWGVMYELYEAISGYGSMSTFYWSLAAVSLVSLLVWDLLDGCGIDVESKGQSQSHTD